MLSGAAVSPSTSALPHDDEVVGACLSLGFARPRAKVEGIVIKGRVEAYRLRDAGAIGDVIAKRRDQRAAMIEQTVYDRILPMSGVPALKCYGRVDIEGSDSCWLFIEDAGGERFSADRDSGHLPLAARWLASMHLKAAGKAHDAAKRGELPIHDLPYYLDHLRQARARILESISVNRDAAAHRDLLEDIARRCDYLEQHSDLLQSVCAPAPRTLIHGDFVEKNLRVCQLNGAAVLKVFDWDMAGFGVPAADIAQCEDLDSYAQVVNIPLSELRGIALAGKIFRWACAVGWKSHLLVDGRVESAVHTLQVYHREIEGLLAEVAEL